MLFPFSAIHKGREDPRALPFLESAPLVSTPFSPAVGVFRLRLLIGFVLLRSPLPSAFELPSVNVISPFAPVRTTWAFFSRVLDVSPRLIRFPSCDH